MLLLRVVRPGGGGLFRLFGELDASNVWELDHVQGRARGGEDVVLDLAELTYMDSSGIKSLIQVARKLGEGANLILLSPRPAVARVLELTRIADVLPNLVVVPMRGPSSAIDEQRGAKPVLPQPDKSSTGSEPTPTPHGVISLGRRPTVAISCHGGRSATVARPRMPKDAGADEDLPFIWLG